MENIDIKFTINEVNAVLNILASRPFNEVAELIIKIKEQAETQVSKMPKGE